VFAVNRDLDEPAALSVGLRAFPGYRLVEHLTISDDDIYAVNTLEQPDRVTPSSRVVSGVPGDSVEVILPAVSWNVLRFERTTP
jgi:alpha-N-arabinofuranosidase